MNVAGPEAIELELRVAKYEVKDQKGNWWPAMLVTKHADGTYDAKLNEKHGTVYHKQDYAGMAQENIRETQEKYLPEHVNGQRVIISTEEAGIFLVHNAELQAKTPGLGFRGSRDMDDRLGHQAFAAWGAMVKGVLKDGWLEVEPTGAKGDGKYRKESKIEAIKRAWGNRKGKLLL